ncbi:MAG: hypothetical protein H7Y38_11520 [Armatimonadetes bacterium]|nr:hypothetical protein [Armatimonadota bacterium]
MFKPSHFLVTTLCAAALTVATPARAQFAKSGDAYYVSADHTLSTDISGNDVIMGRTADESYVPGTVTLTITNGAKVTGTKKGTLLKGYNVGPGVYLFGTHRVNVTGGSVDKIGSSQGSDINISGGNVGFISAGGALHISGGNVDSVNPSVDSTTNISGGNIKQVAAMKYSIMNISGGNFNGVTSYEAAVVNISGGTIKYVSSQGYKTIRITGGTVEYASGRKTAILAIGGGTVTSARGMDESKTIMSGGVLPNGFELHTPQATLDIVGTNLSYIYKGYAKNKFYGADADCFAVTGTFGRVAKTINVYIRTTDWKNGGANGTARQFTFNGGAPVAANETRK